MAYSLTGLSDTDISQNKPIKATQGQQLRDNIIAVPAGDTGAPRIVAGAMHPVAAGDEPIIKICSTGSSVVVDTGALTTPVTKSFGFFTAVIGCTVRVYFTVTIPSGGLASGNFKIIRDGTTLLTQSSSTTSSLDVTLTAGQGIWFSITAQESGGGGTTGTVSALQIRGDIPAWVLSSMGERG